jgi:hypothetical protein
MAARFLNTRRNGRAQILGHVKVPRLAATPKGCAGADRVIPHVHPTLLISAPLWGGLRLNVAGSAAMRAQHAIRPEE